MSAGKVTELRSEGMYKLYKVQGQKTNIFIGKKFGHGLHQLKINRADADKCVGLPKSNFVEFCQQMLEAAKREGLPNYEERIERTKPAYQPKKAAKARV